MRTSLRVFLLLFFTATAVAQQPGVDQRVEELLARMTLDEKLGQLTQYVPGQTQTAAALRAGRGGSVLSPGGAANVNELQKHALASRLKIPVLIGYDVIHGYRTIFPIPLAIAATWDPQLAELSARIAAREARAMGIHWTFAPMVDIARDARWGRIAEGAGEDPVLGSAMAAAYVRGFQSEGLLATAKHFAAYGGAEGGRDYAPVEMSESTLREIYLPPFKAAVDAGVATLMSAFNTINGVPASANSHILDQILRREWKFNGFVVSDYSAVAELIKHGIAANNEEAALKAITAGVDMNMTDESYATLAKAVRDGRLPAAVVDEAVRRVLRAKFRIGLMDKPLIEDRAITVTAEGRAAARRVAQQSIVLLKNEGGLLPLSKQKSIALIGPLADSKADLLGSWAGEGKAEDVVTVREGMRAVASNLIHEQGTGVRQGSDELMNRAVAVAKKADVIVAVLGEDRDMSGEAASRASLDLPGRQQELLEKLVATGKPVVLVLSAGRPLSIPWAAERVPAILHAWQGGIEAGNAIADVLFGSVNPSAKLPVTVPRTAGQVPIFYNHLPTGRPPDPKEKYTSKYIDVDFTPLYPFGFGLSYTRFEYSNLRLSSRSFPPNGKLVVSADIRNAGSRAGEEIVQLYVADQVASVSRPVKELKSFQRVPLAAGQTRRVEFTITPDLLAFWSDRGWITEPGEFSVWIGPDSASGLHAEFELGGQ